MVNRDLASNAQTYIGIAPQLADNTTVNLGANSNGDIDVTGFRWAYVIVSVGATDTTADFKVQESLDGSGTGGAGLGDWADITGAAFTQFGALDDGTVKVGQIDLDKYENHIRVGVTVGDGTTGANVQAVVVLTADKDTLSWLPTTAVFSV